MHACIKLDLIFILNFFICSHTQQDRERAAPKSKKLNKKKVDKYAEYSTAPDNAVYFLFDVETTGSKRNWDKIIAMSFLCYDASGNKLDNFTTKINPGDVQISSYLTENIHGESCMTAIRSPIHSRSATEYQLLPQEFRTQTCAMRLDLPPWQTS